MATAAPAPTILPPRWPPAASCLTKQADIRMAAEDLRISPKEVRVRYEFVNDGKTGRRYHRRVSAAGYRRAGVLLRTARHDDGYRPRTSWASRSRSTARRSTATPEERAVQDGSDVTAQVKAAGLPINIVGERVGEKDREACRRRRANRWRRRDCSRSTATRRPSALDRPDEVLVEAGLSRRERR